jgi:hypothetical protein
MLNRPCHFLQDALTNKSPVAWYLGLDPQEHLIPKAWFPFIPNTRPLLTMGKIHQHNVFQKKTWPFFSAYFE